MKRLVVVVFGVALGVSAAGYQHLRRPPQSPRRSPRRGPDRAPVGSIDKIAHNLYVVPGGGGNTAVFITASGVLLVDTKYAEDYPVLIEQVRTVTAAPIAYVVNTHIHGDHTGGNRFLTRDVEIIAQTHTADRLNETRLSSSVPLARGFENRLTLFSGDDAVELFHFGPAHTDGDTFVVFRAAGVMHAGDVFPGRMSPVVNVDLGGNGVTYPQVLLKASAVPGIKRVITGHGPVVEQRELLDFAEFYDYLLEYVDASMRSGRDKNEAFNSVSFPEKFKSYGRGRAFATLDEIDRSLRPRWLRVLPPVFSRYLMQPMSTTAALEVPPS
jgi:cyclase